MLVSDIFGVIFLEPGFRGVDVCEHLEMLGVTDLLLVLTLRGSSD
jgi:hypothetical protein